MEVKVAGATLELRTMKLTRALLKQFRVLRALPDKFRAGLSESERIRKAELDSKAEWTPEEQKERGELAEKYVSSAKLNPDFCVGWVHGSVLGEEGRSAVVFLKDGDGYLYKVYDYHWKPESWCKQLYL